MAQLVKNPPAMRGDLGLIPGLGRSPGEGKGYPLQYSGLENSMGCIVHGLTKSRTWPSDFGFHFKLLVNLCIYERLFILTCQRRYDGRLPLYLWLSLFLGVFVYPVIVSYELTSTPPGPCAGSDGVRKGFIQAEKLCITNRRKPLLAFPS